MKKKLGMGSPLPMLSMVLFRLTGSAMRVADMADIPQNELMQRIRTNRANLILDVRSPEEYAEGHIPGAINIPYDQLRTRLAEISSHKNKEIVLYCKIGKRVIIAATILQAAGFNHLLHLLGDMDDWCSNGNLPVSVPPASGSGRSSAGFKPRRNPNEIV